jgi:hypothetical protein
MTTRRTFIKKASMMAIAATALGARQGQAQQVSNSTGTESPKLKAPQNACDCHMHIYDHARFPMPPSTRLPPSDATVSDYRMLQKRIGTTRVVIVQPRNYAIDNRVTVDAIAQLGLNARGVAVLHPTVTEAELKTLHEGGIRGIRFTLGDPATAVVKVEMIEPLAKRVAGLGWHVQFNVEGEQIVQLADLMRRLPTQWCSITWATAAGGGHRAPVACHRPRTHRQAPRLGQALGRVLEQQDRTAVLPRGDQGRAGLRESGARTTGVGKRLAAPDHAQQQQAERRLAVRPTHRVGPGRGDAQPHPGAESGSALRLSEIGLIETFRTNVGVNSFTVSPRTAPSPPGSPCAGGRALATPARRGPAPR